MIPRAAWLLDGGFHLVTFKLKFVADNIALWVVAKYLILIGDWYYIQLDLCINIPGSFFL